MTCSLRPARGIVVGIAISLALWGIIALAIYATW
jgi:hypothetical protein